ncbi:hypothetical protein ACM66B_005202 [Microbotryomycetes sp. NB124-2]
MTEDPMATFFPDSDKVDLYDVLKVARDATPQEVKSAYRRLALLHHPDKVASSSSTTSVQDVNLKFQQIGFAYNVLSDETRRKRYDESGRTDEVLSGKTEAEWKDYFKELWRGEVSKESIEKFAQQYKGSDEEKQDLFNAYKTFEGDVESILNNIMCSTHEDEDRFVKLIDEAIKARQLPKLKQWTKSSKDVKAKQKRKDKADKEAQEAEAYAKELGVFEQLKNGKSTSGKSKAGSKNGGDASAAENDDEAGLRALIQGNQQKRMSALMDSLEAKYGSKAGNKKSKKRASTGGDDSSEGRKGGSKKQKEVEPSEEEFQKIQAEIDARRKRSSKK